MARRLNMALLATIMIASLLHVSQAQTTHTVGGSMGWVIPPGGASVYSSWAANQSFVVGDILVFNFATGAHDVAEVTQADYDACNTTSPISFTTTSPARITLNSAGSHYFFCNFTGHCSAGQKLMVTVSAATGSPAPQPSAATTPAPQPSAATTPAPQPASPSPTPVSAPSPAPVSATPPAPVSAPASSPSSRSPMTYTVGDSTGWTIPTGGATFYSTWAAGKTFAVGDSLVFNYQSGAHDVAEVTSANFASCNGASPISLNRTGPTTITLTSAGEHYYICTVSGHCSAGQQLAINVSSTATAPSPSTTTSPPSPTTPSPQSPGGVATPPTPGNSATSLGVASLFVTFLSMLVALVY